MNEPTFWRFVLRVKDFEWANAVLRDDGWFAVVSSYGNYAFRWSSIGERDFRAFFAGIDAGYAMSKLGTRDSYDPEQTIKNVRQRILELQRDGVLSKEEARHERELIEDYEQLDHEYNFWDWLRGTKLGEAWELSVRDYDRDLRAFAKHMLPELQKVVRAHLAAESLAAKEPGNG